MMRKSNIITSAHVRCSGHVHTISITKDGALIFHDHPHLREELVLFALSGESCRCLQVLQAWRKWKPAGIPQKLRPALRAARNKARERAERRISGVDSLSVPLRERVVQRTAQTARQALASCAYRRARSRWAGGRHYVVVFVGSPNIKGYAERVWSRNGRWCGRDSNVVATVSPTWLIRVYKRGLAVVDGMFVLDILHENEHGILVLAGRQGRGFEVYPCRALITQAADGMYHIRRWLKIKRKNSPAFAGQGREK